MGRHPAPRLRWREAPRLCFPPREAPRPASPPTPVLERRWEPLHSRPSPGRPPLGTHSHYCGGPAARSSGGRSLRGLPGSFTRAPAVSQALRGGLRSGSRGRRLSSAPRALRRAGGLHVAPGPRLSHCRWEHVLSEGGPRAPPASGQETRLPRVQGPAGRCTWVALGSVHAGEVPGHPGRVWVLGHGSVPALTEPGALHLHSEYLLVELCAGSGFSTRAG